MTGNEIRKIFLEFFKSKGHRFVPSDSLVPKDPTLLFTSAGMVQFKPMFLATEKLEYSTAVSCQKCFRTPDLERVGHTIRHHTFFEMLGNFSFGDYFKKEAIEYAWEFVVDVLKLPKDDLWISIYLDDNEAYEIWKKTIGVPENRIIRLGKEENFWGPVSTEGGPCGPCSEIYIDFGPKYGCGKASCKPGCECNRFEEFWNLVFQQYNQDEKGILNPLPKGGIDTGLGLERLTAILQGVQSNFETDLIKPIINEISLITGVQYGKNKDFDVHLRIIADHIRAITFLISDGVLPSNDGRGYVLRRILRRAFRFGKLMGLDKPFLYTLVGTVTNIMKESYPELTERRENISKITLYEEERFKETLNTGEELLNQLIEKGEKKISGKDAFKLYDTYGFPLELTKEIAQERNITVDENEFKTELEKQQHQARTAWKGSGESTNDIYHTLLNKYKTTEFLGYETLESDSTILAILKNNDNIEILLDKTPFYGESGGQVGDTGTLTADGINLDVINTYKPIPELIIHKVKINKGNITEEKKLHCIVNKEYRNAIARHHTATHLLQWALREVLGTHITQSGSLVSSESLRFDFTHFSAIKPNELKRIEELANEKILENLCVTTKEMSIKEARKEKVIALFGEKYGEKVRMVEIDKISKELCGGTHIKATGELGSFKIIGEESVAAGVRRITAVTGMPAYKMVLKTEELIETIALKLKTSSTDIQQKIEQLLQRNKSQEKEIENLKTRLAGEGENLMSKLTSVEGINILPVRLDGMDINSLRKIGDSLKTKIKSGIIILGSANENKANLVVMVTSDISAKLQADKIIKEFVFMLGGSGGGKPELAQAGCKDILKLDVALNSATEIIKKILH